MVLYKIPEGVIPDKKVDLYNVDRDQIHKVVNQNFGAIQKYLYIIYQINLQIGDIIHVGKINHNYESKLEIYEKFFIYEGSFFSSLAEFLKDDESVHLPSDCNLFEYPKFLTPDNLLSVYIDGKRSMSSLGNLNITFFWKTRKYLDSLVKNIHSYDNILFTWTLLDSKEKVLVIFDHNYDSKDEINFKDLEKNFKKSLKTNSFANQITEISSYEKIKEIENLYNPDYILYLHSDLV